MCLIRVILTVKIFICIYQCSGKHYRVLKMYIIISCTVYQQKLSFQLISHFFRGIIIISFGVFLRSTHITLCINVIIITPVGNRRHSYCHLKYIIALQKAGTARKAAITPAPYTNTFFVHIRQFAQFFSNRYLVIAFILTQLQVSLFPELFAPEPRSCAISAHYYITLLSQHLVPEIITYRETICNLL